MALSYVTQQDLLNRDESMLWVLATSPDDNSQLNTVAIDAAISDASVEIDSFLTCFELPLLEVPALLNRCAISMAFYWLADRDGNISELVQKRYDDALRTLREIRDGKRDLGLPAASKPTETAKGKAEVIDASRPSVRDSLRYIL
ncbi:DUF1320 domain-containing protein [Vibrio ruber]|uniref:gp436 family protein n=1 Tax=Vibrio ruber TaxID=184755 RepID=UPI0028929949|nr:DUF1320 domain-containing protein [Vibrio ruber]WNJ96543.1 DUF1320 domain-containing protein [Vibrio ruber]